MCEITGYSNQNDEIKELGILQVQDMTFKKGTFSDKNIKLFHSGLSVPNFSDAEHQPLFYAPDIGASSEKHKPEHMTHAKAVIVYTGKLYNQTEIKSLLQSKGYKFNTLQDAELIAAAYLEWGTECVLRFNGEWSFCIYDRMNEILFLSRDRIGVKTLYYHESKNMFIFSSELKTFYKLLSSIEIDQESLNHYLILNASPIRKTLIKDVFKLLPGTNMIYDLKSKKTALIKKYWSTKFDINEQNESKIIPRIKDILEDAVKKRTSPDLQSGIILNGGIESSILLMLLKKKSTNVKTFSVKYNYNDNNTSQYAKIISDQFLTEHTEIECNATDIKNLIEAIPNYYDEPIGNSLMIPSYIISKEASNHVKEMFYSTGSDEIFGGKAIYLDYEKLIKIQNKLGLFRHFACTKYKKKNPDKAEKIKALIKEKNSKLFYVKLLSNYLKNSDETWNSPTLSEDFDVLFGNTEALNTLLSFDQNYLLPEQFLFTENRIARTFGTEHKFPFLDYRMIEFANKIEPGLKIKGDIVKYILRESYKNELSPQILKQKNIQPEVPLKQYFKNEMKTYTEEIIFDNLHHFRELNAEYIRKIWNIHQSKQSDYAPIFWNLLMLVKWHEHYIAK